MDELKKLKSGEPFSVSKQANRWIGNINQFGGLRVSPPMSLTWTSSGPKIGISIPPGVTGNYPEVVLVRHYGGVVGDSDTTSTLAYWVENQVDGAFIASDVTPEVPRYPKTRYVCPGSDYYGSAATRYGLWDPKDEVLLVAYGEVPFASDCPP